MDADAVTVTQTPVEPLATRYRRWVGPGAEERHPPSLPVALAGAAAALAALALGSLGGEALEDGSRGVAVLAAVLFGVAGLVLVTRPQPLRAAGTVAVGTSVLLAIGFLILGDSGYSSSEPTVVLAASTVTWGALHFLGPARGSAFLLAATLAGAWATFVVEFGIDTVFAGTPFAAQAPFPFTGSTEVVVISIAFGAVYLLVADALDRSGLRGTATVFAGVGIVALGVGVWVGSVGRDLWLAGSLLTLAGAVVALFGARSGRRLSTWVGAAAVAIGVVVVTSEFTQGDDAETAGPLVGLVTSAALVALTPGLARALGESPPERAIAANAPPPPIEDA